MKQFKCALFMLLCLLVCMAYAKVRPSATSVLKYAPAPPADTVRGLIGYYYQDKNDNNHFTTLKQGGVYDTTFSVNWGNGNPGYGLSDDYFSIRWIGMLKAPVTGTYTFNSNADDGLKFSIKDFANRSADKGKVIMDNNGNCCHDFSGTVDLEAGKLYPIEIEYFENTGGANIMYFKWQAPGLPQQQVLANYLYAMQPPEAARPKITPDKGLFEGEVEIKFSTNTEGGVIHYTLDGTIPTINSPVYDPSGKLTVSTTAPYTFVIKASTYKEGMFVSEVSTSTITVMPPALPKPVFVPSAGLYTGSVDLDISVNVPGSTLYYTTDGSTPTTSSTLYTGKLHLDTTTRIKVFAVKEGRSPSQVVAGTYTILPEGVKDPVFSLAAGSYNSAQEVTITSATPGATIYYAFDDKVLNSNSPVYSTPVKINSSTTLKAYATLDGLTDSKATQATYIIGNDATVSTPKFSVAPGTYTGVKQVGLYTDTKDASIHYTLDGSTPDENSQVFYMLISVKDSVVINAIAYKAGMKPSAIATGKYIISEEARDTSLINTNLPIPKLSITPNPASNVVRISWTGMITTKTGFRVVVTDSKGTVVNTSVVQGGYTYYQFNTSTLAEGIYYVKVESGNSIAKGKMIVAR
ncbi:T9SS C-terminal target domain-containing protein [Chitinophaga silvatica]|uniref:T9SS C-terminal target domain-containing protein n=1 Tax=Chitinophaga silvatica TaxID=2282649 RepID=A0A3E1Y8S0_9BACT|nr:chitobiase/beta-hexosaminidase C-terminal domain-containing protein [Chitinophaga silvatica]RFS21818.1 T9SS C-terminal target domain-containing protein [Chitinophaga silvatica]